MSTHTATLGKISTTERTAATSQRNLARIAGVLYLIIIVSGIFAHFIVRASMIEPGDTTATANNILASEGLFRLGILGDLVMIMSDVAIGLVFYVLFKPVNNGLSLLAAFFRLTQAIILGANLLHLFFVTHLLSGADYLNTLGTDQINAQVLFYLDAHTTGYAVGLLFFALSTLILGYLVFKSGYLPRFLGVLLIIAGAAYLIDNTASLLYTHYAEYEEIFSFIGFVPTFTTELLLGLWLLVKGVAAHKQANHV